MNDCTTSLKLGRFIVLPPLRVDLKETEDGWMAYLLPAEETGHEFGWGKTIQASLIDLEEVIAEMKQHLRQMPLGEELKKYKELLTRCVIIS